MQNPQILSTQLSDSKSAPARPRVHAKVRRALVFEACAVGVLLRTVLFVKTVLRLGVMYFADTLLEWLTRLAFTGDALPRPRWPGLPPPSA